MFQTQFISSKERNWAQQWRFIAIVAHFFWCYIRRSESGSQRAIARMHTPHNAQAHTRTQYTNRCHSLVLLSLISFAHCFLRLLFRSSHFFHFYEIGSLERYATTLKTVLLFYCVAKKNKFIAQRAAKLSRLAIHRQLNSALPKDFDKSTETETEIIKSIDEKW